MLEFFGKVLNRNAAKDEDKWNPTRSVMRDGTKPRAGAQTPEQSTAATRKNIKHELKLLHTICTFGIKGVLLNVLSLWLCRTNEMLIQDPY